MSQKLITFDFKPTKFLNAVVFFAESCPASTKKKICKLLFFADKEHLLKYGTTITGDAYYRLDHGPIPTYGLDLLRGKGQLPDLELTRSYLEVKGIVVKPKRRPNMGVFSKSEIATLEQIMRLLGSMSADSLEHMSHQEPAWTKSRKSERIDFALLFEGHPEAKVAKEIAESESEERAILARYRAES